MTGFAASTWRRLRGLVAPDPAPRDEGTAAAVLDGLSAVTMVEAAAGEAAAVGAGFPASTAARCWRRRGRNLWNEPLMAGDTDDPRSAVSSGLALAMSGQRTTVFLAGPDALAARDLLATAAGRRLPLVTHLACRAGAGHAHAMGTSHDAYHALADTGVFLLFATSVQDAVDLALVARRVTERSLVPGVVAMDGEQTALAAQDVLMPSVELIRAYLGVATDLVDAPAGAQRMLFGPTRRRVPRWFDVDRPMMLAPFEGPESWALGAAGARPFFADPVAGRVDEAFAALARETGRDVGMLVEDGLDDARIVVVAQGSAVETAIAVARAARANERLRVGVLGIRCLRPLPARRVVETLRRAAVVVVLERSDSPLVADGMLTRELRAEMQRGRENASRGRDASAAAPSVRAKDEPRFVPVACGRGGLPLRAADLLALLRTIETRHPPGVEPRGVELGLRYVTRRSAYPKRDVLSDALRREQPELETRGLRGDEPSADVRPEGSITVAIHRLAGGPLEHLAGDAASLLLETSGAGHVRSRPGLSWHRAGEPCVDVLTHATARLYDPGDDAPVDVAVVAGIHPRMDPLRNLRSGGTVIVAGDPSDDAFARGLPPALIRAAARGACDLCAVKVSDGEVLAPDAALEEALLGAVVGVLSAHGGRTKPSAAQLRSARAHALGGADPARGERDEDADDRAARLAARLDALVAALDAVARVDPATPACAPAPGAAAPHDAPAPTAVRDLARTDRTVDSLPRFWDQIGVVYRDGARDELTSDPYLAAGAVPPFSAAFRDVGAASPTLVAFDPPAYEGDPSIWTSSPDGAIAGLVIGARTLIDAGIERAGARGRPADALRSVAGKLARECNRVMAANADAAATAGTLLRAAFEAVVPAAGPSDDRRASLAAALDAVVDDVGDLPVARTPVFFDEPEREKPGAGELFTLVVDPEHCTGGDVALHECGGRGLVALPRTAENVERAEGLWRLVQELPDTSGATIARAREHAVIGPMAAMLLSRHCALAMSGGDAAEPGSGSALAVRWIAAAAELHLQPRWQRWLTRIEELRSRLADSIRDELAEALPTGDLDALAGGLETLGRTDVDLSTLSATVDRAVEGGRVDGARLGRLVEAARGLSDLTWRLTRGIDGRGRARMSVAAGPATSWAGVFPHNPFACPVVFHDGPDPCAFAGGLVEGQLRQTMAAVRLTRIAETEAGASPDRPPDVRSADLWREDVWSAGASPKDAHGASELTVEERALCPPLIVIGDGRGGIDAAALARLADAGLPVKLVVLSGIGGRAAHGLEDDEPAGHRGVERHDLALTAIACRRVFVAQTSPADRDHFARAVGAALDHDGPAVIHVHCPSPADDGFPAGRLLEQGRLALRSGALTLLTYDPARAGVFGTRLELAAEDCAPSDEPAATLTTVDWAATERRFREHLTPVRPDDPAPTPIADYLAMSEEVRRGRTAWVAVALDSGATARLRVGRALIEDALERRALRQTLEELAGVVTPFTGAVRETAQRETAAAHAAELERLREECDARIAELRARYTEEATQRVTDGLLALAGYDADPAGGGP